MPDLSESISRFKTRMQVVSAGWRQRVKARPVSWDGLDRQAAGPCAPSAAPASGTADLPQYLTSDLGPLQPVLPNSLPRFPTHLPPLGPRLTKSRGHTCNLWPADLATQEPETSALGPRRRAEAARQQLAPGQTGDAVGQGLQPPVQAVLMQTERSEERRANTTGDPPPVCVLTL